MLFIFGSGTLLVFFQLEKILYPSRTQQISVISFIQFAIFFSSLKLCHLLHCFRKGIAPHLKSLIGPWWFSQFDPAPEVAQAARRSFEVGARPSLINVTGCNLLLLDYLDLLHPFLTWNARRKILNPLRTCFDRQGFTQSLWIGRKVNSFSS